MINDNSIIGINNLSNIKGIQDRKRLTDVWKNSGIVGLKENN